LLTHYVPRHDPRLRPFASSASRRAPATPAHFPRNTLIDITSASVELTIDGHANIKVNKAHISTADIGALNGVIHVIDAALLPPSA